MFIRTGAEVSDLSAVHPVVAAINACTADLAADRIAAARAQHERERDDDLSDDLAGEEWHTRYRPDRVKLKCGCVAHLEADCDGENVWKEWRWNADKCCVLGGAA